LITQTLFLRTTKAYGQLLGRDFNPLAKLLLLRTSVPIDFIFWTGAVFEDPRSALTHRPSALEETPRLSAACCWLYPFSLTNFAADCLNSSVKLYLICLFLLFIITSMDIINLSLEVSCLIRPFQTTHNLYTTPHYVKRAYDTMSGKAHNDLSQTRNHCRQAVNDVTTKPYLERTSQRIERPFQIMDSA
jgi:hypothetical protein